MTKTDKQIERLKAIPKDYTFSEARALAIKFGYAEYQKGKTSGSRILFYRERDGRKILLHKPHPNDVMPVYAVRDLLNAFCQNGDM